MTDNTSEPLRWIIERDGTETPVDAAEVENQAAWIMAQLLYARHESETDPFAKLLKLTADTSVAYAELIVTEVFRMFTSYVLHGNEPMPQAWAFSNLQRLALTWRGIRFNADTKEGTE
jgi:hypothetical protein